MTEQRDYVRISLQIPPNLLVALDDKAKSEGRSRSFEAIQRLAKSLGVKLSGKPAKKK